MAKEYIYTTPGATPVSFDTETPVTQEQIGATLAATNPVMALASFLGSIPDFGIDALKGLVDLGQHQGRLYEKLGKDRPGLAELADSDLANAIKSIPEGVVTEAVQNALTFGNREKLIETMGGDTAFKAAPLLGMIPALPLLTEMSPGLAAKFDIGADILGGTPGATQALQSAKTIPGLIGTSAGIGLGSSLLPAVHYATDPTTGEFDKSIFTTTALTGLGAGAALPGVLMAPMAAKGAVRGVKGVLDNIVQGTGQMIKQSDQMKTIREISQAAYDRQRMQEFTAAKEAETIKAYEPEIKTEPTVPKVEKTFAKKVASYEEVPDVRKMQQEDLIKLSAEENRFLSDFETKSRKYEDELGTLSSYIEEAKAKPIEVSDAEIKNSYKGLKSQKEIVDDLRAIKKEELTTERTKVKEELSSALDQQLILKEKEKNLAKLIKEKTTEELEKQFNKPIKDVQSKIQKDIESSEKQISKIHKQLAKLDSKLEKTIPVKRDEVQARLDQMDQEKQKLREELLQQKQNEQQKLIDSLETEADSIFGRYEKEKAAHQERLNKIQQQKQEVINFAPEPKLPAIIPKTQTETIKPRFISGPEGIKEYDIETGLPVPIKDVNSYSPKTGEKTPLARIVETVADGSTERVSNNLADSMTSKAGKYEGSPAEWFNTVSNQIIDINKSIGRKFQKFTNALLYKPNQYMERFFNDYTIKKLKHLTRNVPDHIIYSEDMNLIREYSPELAKFLENNYKPMFDELYKQVSKYDSRISDRRKSLNQQIKKARQDGDEKLATELEKYREETIIVRDIKDKEGLEVYLEKISPGYSEELSKLINQGIPESTANSMLMKKRKIKVTPEMEKYYHTWVDSMQKRVAALNSQIELGKFLKQDLSKYAGDIDQIPKLVNEFLVSEGVDDITQRLALRDVISRYLYKPGKTGRIDQMAVALSRLAASSLLGNLDPALRQLSFPARLGARTGFMNMINGIFSKFPITHQKLTNAFLNEIPKNNQNWLDLWGNWLRVTFTPMAELEVNKTMSIMGQWLAQNANKGKPRGNFKLFLDKWFEPEDQIKLLNELRTYKGDINSKPLSEDIVDAILTSSIHKGGLVLSEADKPLVAKEKGLSSLLYMLKSYQLKDSKINRDLILDAIKAGDYGTAAQNITSMLTVDAAGLMLFESLIELKNQKTSGDQETLTTDKIKQKYLQLLIEKYTPLVNGYLVKQAYENPTEAIFGMVTPAGSKQLVQNIGGKISRVTEGDPAALIDSSDSIFFKSSPVVPGALGEIVMTGAEMAHSKSILPRARQEKRERIRQAYDRQVKELPEVKAGSTIAKQEQMATTREKLKQLRLGPEYQYLIEDLNPKNANTKRGSEALVTGQSILTDIKEHQAKNYAEGTIGRGRKQFAKSMEPQIRKSLYRLQQSGKITSGQASQIWQNRHTIIFPELDRVRKKSIILEDKLK